jgi:hypothetical protein
MFGLEMKRLRVRIRSTILRMKILKHLQKKKKEKGKNEEQ